MPTSTYWPAHALVPKHSVRAAINPFSLLSYSTLSPPSKLRPGEWLGRPYKLLVIEHQTGKTISPHGLDARQHIISGAFPKRHHQQRVVAILGQYARLCRSAY